MKDLVPDTFIYSGFREELQSSFASKERSVKMQKTDMKAARYQVDSFLDGVWGVRDRDGMWTGPGLGRWDSVCLGRDISGTGTGTGTGTGLGLGIVKPLKLESSLHGLGHGISLCYGISSPILSSRTFAFVH